MGSIRSERVDRRALRHVRKDTPLQELLDAAEEVRGLLSHPGWAHVEAAIAAEVDAINRRLNSGDEPLSRAQYAKSHGRLGGLLYVREALDAIVQRADERYREQQRKHEGVAEPAPEGALA